VADTTSPRPQAKAGRRLRAKARTSPTEVCWLGQNRRPFSTTNDETK
jgi:hypothetical protein